jgi:hypothetical protein
MPTPAELPEIVRRHFPGADLIQRRSLGAKRMSATLLRYEAIPGRVKSVAISSESVRIMTLVDWTRTVSEIAELLKQE